MARVNASDALAEIKTVLEANDGKMTYRALIAAIPAQYIPFVRQLTSQGALVSSMAFESEDAPRAVSFVALPEGAAE